MSKTIMNALWNYLNKTNLCDAFNPSLIWVLTSWCKMLLKIVFVTNYCNYAQSAETAFNKFSKYWITRRINIQLSHKTFTLKDADAWVDCHMNHVHLISMQLESVLFFYLFIYLFFQNSSYCNQEMLSNK